MTASELGEELQLKESYIKTHWNRIVETYKRKGIELYKIGRGSSTNYGIKSYDDITIRWKRR